MEEYISSIMFDPVVGKIVTTAAGIAVILVIAHFIKRSLRRYVSGAETRYKARKVISFIAYLASVVYITVVYSNQLGGLTVAFGVAGAGIAFALQEVIASFAGWIAISLGGFYNTGDRVQLGGIKGDIIDIGVLRTTLMEVGDWVKGDLYNGRVVRIANSFVFKEPVFNYSGDFPFLWDEIVLPVKYGCNREKVRQMLEQIGKEVTAEFVAEAKESWPAMVGKYLVEDARIEPMVTLVANDNWMEFTLRYVVNYKRRRLTKDVLFTKILDAVDASKGKIVLASATFELVGAPPIVVRKG